MSNTALRLTDAQVAQFIAHGHEPVTPDLSSGFHDEEFAAHEEVFARESNPGNNQLPLMPQIHQVFADPAVVGALEGLLGSDYYLQPHRHSHNRTAHSPGQTMHRDGGARWSHRTRYLLAFYYPQETPVERGPSGIVPGSHYFATAEGARNDHEMPVVTPGGTVTIVHYDLWHRGMANTTDHTRYMVKFLFARMNEPVQPSWNNDQVEWPGSLPALDGDGPELQKMYGHSWSWQRGNGITALPPPDGRTPDELLPALASEDERQGIAAAYDLAGFGADAVPSLIDTLDDNSEMTRRHAACALSAVGGPAVGALTEALARANPTARADAAAILGDIGLIAAPAITALIAASKDPTEAVRRHACDALGTVVQDSPVAVPTLMDALADQDAEVRVAATFSLCRLGPHAAEAVSALEGVLDDENRYVRADALHAMKRIGTPEATETLIEHLMPARWCPITTRESQY